MRQPNFTSLTRQGRSFWTHLVAVMIAAMERKKKLNQQWKRLHQMHRCLSLECKNGRRSKSGRDGEGNVSRNSNRLDGECDHALAGSGCVSKVRPFKPFHVSTLLRQGCAKPLRRREGLSFHQMKFRSPRLPKLTIFSLTACIVVKQGCHSKAERTAGSSRPSLRRRTFAELHPRLCGTLMYWS